MKLPTIFFLAVSVTVGAFGADAQTAASPTPAPTPRPTPPTPPFIVATPDFAAWTITSYNVTGLGSQTVDGVLTSAAKTANPESQVSVTKTGRIRHQTRKLKTGGEDIWYENGNKIVMESMWALPMFQPDANGPKSPTGPDFPELSWISAGNFVGTHADATGTYFVFETQLSEGSTTLAKEYGYTLTKTFHRAYINADTRLPGLHQTGDLLERYSFQIAPTTPLEVPPQYQTMFDAYEKRKINAARKPVAP